MNLFTVHELILTGINDKAIVLLKKMKFNRNDQMKMECCTHPHLCCIRNPDRTTPQKSIKPLNFIRKKTHKKQFSYQLNGKIEVKRPTEG